MKHTLKITLLLLTMFLVTQAIGLYVVNHYAREKNELPFGLEPPPVEKESDYYNFFSMIVFAFVFAIIVFILLTKIKIDFFLRLWFFAVVFIALSVSFLSFISKVQYAFYISLFFAFALAFFKVYSRNIWVHNLTEFFVYPGIAAVFVPILNVYTVILLLILISIYDIWAVWHSGIMQKMAKYQIKKLKVFSGFFVPYFTKELREKIKKWKKYARARGGVTKQLANKKIKVNIAILGGGDIVFPIITAGVVLETLGIYHALFVILGATLGLSYLFFYAKKKKFYPAMPFITGGILVGILAGYLIF